MLRRAIIEKSIEIKSSDTYGPFRMRGFLESVDMIVEVIDLSGKEGFTPKRINNLGKIYTIPNSRQWTTLRIKVF